jgi:hypothetical protein
MTLLVMIYEYQLAHQKLVESSALQISRLQEELQIVTEREQAATRDLSVLKEKFDEEHNYSKKYPHIGIHFAN